MQEAKKIVVKSMNMEENFFGTIKNAIINFKLYARKKHKQGEISLIALAE